jgi:hypothetical protein
MLDQNLARAANPSPGWEWIVVAEEDWSGVNDCGAIFVPDRAMRFEVDDEEWSRSQSC